MGRSSAAGKSKKWTSCDSKSFISFGECCGRRGFQPVDCIITSFPQKEPAHIQFVLCGLTDQSM